MSIKTYNVKLNGKVYEVEIEEVKSGKQPTMSATPAIVTVEAMKMENEIIAPVDGQISAIHVEKGQNVNLGDVILNIA